MVARVNADALTGLANRVMMAAIPGPSLTDDAAAWLADGLGGVVLFGGNVESPAQLRASSPPRSRPPATVR